MIDIFMFNYFLHVLYNIFVKMEIVEVESEQSQQKVEESHHNINSTSNP